MADNVRHLWMEPIRIGTLYIRNRIFRSATAERAGDTEGRPSDQLIEIYRRLALGGVGLIITGFAFVHSSGRTSPDQSGIHKDELIPFWKRIVDGVKRADPECRIVMQIVHGGRQVSASCVSDPVAPSQVHDSVTGITPREMREDEILEIIDAFGNAARRAKEAGFDGVQVHGAHGFLISSFLSPYTNRRNDRWGGSTENRKRFLIEVLRDIRKKTGKNFTILLKVNGCDFIEGGLEIEETARILSNLDEEGAAAFEISGGMYESRERGAARKFILKDSDEGYFLEMAYFIKKRVSVPVIAVGGFRSLSVIEKALEAKKADAISLSRPLIREPDLVRKFLNGKERADCISCNKCLAARKGMTRCLQIGE